MPGILPMKVIKVGNNAQSRIAQACDRCRSKKIRCDGIRPCCSQCANVGFECKTSDKLSRRAFPRGYTESLEDRVRSLEAEVRELKDLLDEKDEKIDMLSRIHSFSSPSRKASSSLSPAASEEIKVGLHTVKEEVIHVQQPSQPEGEDVRRTFTGPSSTHAFVDAFKKKVAEAGKPCPAFSTKALLSSDRSRSATSQSPTSASRTPPRVDSDNLINIFFQEWAPLFPVLHRPTFLELYHDYMGDPDALQSNKQAVAQLNLVFGIAALSSSARVKLDTSSYERQFTKVLHSISTDVSVSTLQCYVLAQIYCLVKAEYKNLSRFKAIAVSQCHQLGLHQSPRRLSLGTLSAETRRKLFWSLYVLDRFSAAAMGLPVLLKETDIQTEYPADVDDENITEKGFLPTLPGESTRLSSALALFNVSRILTKVLDYICPSSASYEVSISKIHSIEDELDEWLRNLPPHLRLQFSQDKPSTNVTGSRSPLLSLGYYYIRTLIHRPAVCAISGNHASASLFALADCSKHIIQIFQLLNERRMSFSFSLNKNELLLLSGIGVLWQCLELKQDSKLVKDSQKLVNSTIELLERESAPGAADFKNAASALIAVEGVKMPELSQQSSYSHSHSQHMPAPEARPKSARKQLQAIASRFSLGSSKAVKPEEIRRATVPEVSPRNLGQYGRTFSQLSISSARSEPVGPQQPPMKPRSTDLPLETLNLDYLPLGNEPVSACPAMPKAAHTVSDWERVLCSMDNGHGSIYDGIYGGTSPDYLASFPDVYPANGHEWSPDAWNPDKADLQLKAPVAQSVLSYSEESLTSGEDMSGSSNADAMQDPFGGIAIPHLGDDFELEGFGSTI